MEKSSAETPKLFTGGGRAAEIGQRRSFEQRTYEKIKTKLTPDEREYFESVVLENLAARPQIDDFAYPSEEKASDQRAVEQKQAAVEKTSSEQQNISYIRAKILETLINNLAELQNWLGENAFTVETAEYDDWLNGLDQIVEFDQPGAPRRLAIDYTLGTDTERLGEKLQTVMFGIEQRTLAKTKYFRSALDNQPPALSDLPKVLVVLDQKTVSELTALALANDQEKLNQHWARLVLILEIKRQLSFFIEYINRSSRSGYTPRTADVLFARYGAISQIIEQLWQQIAQEKIAAYQTKMPLTIEAFEHLLTKELMHKDAGFKALINKLR